MKYLASIIITFFLFGEISPALEYEKDIMPFLAEKCGECHSQSEKVKGGLRLDDPEHFRSRFDKNSVVVPGDWDASMLFITLFRPPDHKDAMPPKGKGERLTAEETRLVQQWIAEGATIDGETGESGPMPKEGQLGYIAIAEDEASKMPVEQDWTNNEGRTIRATLISVEGDKAVLKTAGGQVYRYPIANLSEKSRSQLPE